MPEPKLPLADAYTLRLPESPAVELDVVDVHIRDALDELFLAQVFAHTRQLELEPADFVGKRAQLIHPALGGEQKLTGIVASMRQEIAEDTGISRYRFVIVPALWLTTKRTNSRIFQDGRYLDVVHEITKDYGDRIPKCVEKLRGELGKRPFIAQYGETDWDMIRRQAAEAGVALCAIHDGNGEIVMSNDFGNVGQRIEERVPFRPTSKLTPGQPHVMSAIFESRVSPGMVWLRDYDYERPKLPLDGRAIDADAFAGEDRCEQFEFAVGKFNEEAAGTTLAGVRLEEARREHELARFKTNVPVAAGTLFTLSDHPRASANIEWLVISSTTKATHRTASHELVAIPAALPYRPQRRPAPRIIGMQTAVVVGEEGSEIDVDEHGRVCVRFRWDRRDKKSETTRRIRVSQGWAGAGYGFVCIPRVGDEVIVDFLDGDPDRPLIVGRVHNGVNVAPQKLPEQKAWSTWRSRSTPGGNGFNEITLDDAAGEERIYVHAQKDVIVEVENDVNAHVKGHVNGLVRGNGSGGILGSGQLKINGDASLEVGGELDVNVGGSITATAGSNIILSAGVQRVDESINHFVRTGGFYVTAKSVAQFNTANFHVFAGDVWLQAGGSHIHITPGDIDIHAVGDIKIHADGNIIATAGVIKLN